MKKRLLSIILVLCMLCTLLPLSAGAQSRFTACHVEDTALKNAGNVTALSDGRATPFSYTVPENGRAILVFFSCSCGNSLSLLEQLGEYGAINTPTRTVYAFECVTSGLDAVRDTINEYAPGLTDKISFYANGSSALWKYVRQTTGGNSITFPLVVVVEQLEGKNVITGYSVGYIGASEMLNGSENIHTHDYKASETVAPGCTEMGYTVYRCSCGESYKGDYIDAPGHHYVNGVCTVCGDREMGSGTDEGDCFYLKDTPLGVEKRVSATGHYVNWAGVSTVSQFTDEKGNFCFAVKEGSSAAIYKIVNGAAKKVFSAPIGSASTEALLGTVVCDAGGYYYIVWGIENPIDDDFYAKTIFISKYSPDGTLIATVSGDGSESLSYNYNVGYNTKIPFDAGNCDAAVSGNTLMVNYAREMYSGHQSNSVFAVNTDTMKRTGSVFCYNSHSFDQRVTPYSKTGGFLLESHGDSYDRCFTTSVTNSSNSVVRNFNSFDFWVEEGAHDRGDMQQLNRTYARLGNILETSCGAALIGSSARSLDISARVEPYDLFVQIFDPTLSASNPDSYVTKGERSGYAGNNGDTYVTNYGVKWLTDLSETDHSIDTVQAVSTDDDRIIVLYRLSDSLYDDEGPTYFMILGPDGSVLKNATCLGDVSLNTDEDPVYTNGAVQWISNNGSDPELILHTLRLTEPWGGDGKAHYSLSADGTLTVSGTGDMPNYSGDLHIAQPISYAPWAAQCDKIKSVVIEDGITSIGVGAFCGCKNLESVTVPDTLGSIGDYAFLGCDKLKTVNIGSAALLCRTSFAALSASAFGSMEFCMNGKPITELVIPDGVTEICDRAFSGIATLKSVTIPASVRSIGTNAFYSCYDLERVNISDIGAWCSIDFENSAANPLYYADELYLNGELPEDLVIPEGVQHIGKYAFLDYSRLQSVTIPASVRSIGKNAFEGCYTHGIYIRDLAAWCGIEFENMYSNPLLGTQDLYLNGNMITELVIPDGVPGIASYAFYNCRALTSAAIPDSVKAIGDSAFYGCRALKNVYYSGSEAQWNGIAVERYNEPLLNASKVFNSAAHYHLFYEVTVPPTCTESGSVYYVCACGYGFDGDPIPPAGHSYSSWMQSEAPTCTKNGSERRFCLLCDAVETREVAAKGHSYSAAVTAPTCTAQGYTTHTCSGCGDSYRDRYVSALGHSYLNGRCSRCGAADPNYTPAPVNPFTDIGNLSKSFQTAILWASSNGIAAGATKTTYNPNGSCTRGQVVTFLWRAAGKPEPTTSANPYNDVAGTAYYYKAILWAAENGITAGYNNPDGSKSFRPGDTVTRGQFVTFLWRYLGKPMPESTANPFNDVKSGGFYNAILWGSGNGIVAGYNNPDGSMSFKPDNPCTRAHVAVFLYRAMA